MNKKPTILVLIAVALASTGHLIADTSSTPAGDPAQRVTGIGGFFFHANDPQALARWYQEKLGIDLVPSDYGGKPWTQEAGPTAFAPFPKDTKFGKEDQCWMIDFRVNDLDAMVAQLRASGEKVKVDPTVYPNGRFARLRDPEGNPVELWEPKRHG
jgi:predicted enzyme related to lactoylglutathione lyase